MYSPKRYVNWLHVMTVYRPRLTTIHHHYSVSQKAATGRAGLCDGFCEGDTRNRWRDGQVCPDVDKELWHLGPDGSGGKEKEQKKEDKKVRGERTDGRRRREREREETERKSGERESEARLEWRKGLSPEIGVKKTMNAGGVENGNMNCLHRLGNITSLRIVYQINNIFLFLYEAVTLFIEG
ncbi:hypothetical protein TNCV_207921 [Trichonephila clavipes]|nr:hypothetical protein TNCV_207921 [Trichonephila clavipes]